MNYPSYRVGDVFPDNLQSAALVRFLVSSRYLFFFSRLNAKLIDEEDTPPNVEDSFYHFLGTISAAQDAIEAFLEADKRGCFSVPSLHPLKEWSHRQTRGGSAVWALLSLSLSLSAPLPGASR